MKPLRLALLIVAFICFVLHVFFEARPIPATAPPTLTRPALFMGLGLAFWVAADIFGT